MPKNEYAVGGYIIRKTTGRPGFRSRSYRCFLIWHDGRVVNSFLTLKLAREWAKAHPAPLPLFLTNVA